MSTIITDATGLDNIRLNLAGDYVLGADIDLSSVPNWVPIGDSTTPFTGTLDFSGYSISGLTISRDTTDYVGLFGYCRFNDALKIPNIKGGTVNGTVAGSGLCWPVGRLRRDYSGCDRRCSERPGRRKTG